MIYNNSCRNNHAYLISKALNTFSSLSPQEAAGNKVVQDAISALNSTFIRLIQNGFEIIGQENAKKP